MAPSSFFSSSALAWLVPGIGTVGVAVSTLGVVELATSVAGSAAADSDVGTAVKPL